MSAQFNIRAADPASVSLLESELGLPRFIAATLVARGIRTPHDAREFLNPSLERDWLDPYTIPGLPEVADALEEAMRAGKHIVVFGDFDLDGISATTVLTRGLRTLGAHATPFIPLRFEEGYGLTEAAFERMRALNPEFIVTVDCGIACKVEAAAIVEAGVGLAITDHHEPVDLVPEGVPVADPKMDERVRSVHPCRRGRGARSWCRCWAGASAIRTCGARSPTWPRWARWPTSCPCAGRTARWWPTASCA